MRLIDADELLTKKFITDDIDSYDTIPVDEIVDAPTIDAVEVVRCKECIHYDPRKFLPCTRLGLFVADEFFCGVGKKAEEAINDA